MGALLASINPVLADTSCVICCLARQQPQRLPIPFEQPAEDTRAYAARQSLDRLGITQSQLVAIILGDSKHLDQLFKLTYQLKTDKKTATKNPR